MPSIKIFWTSEIVLLQKTNLDIRNYTPHHVRNKASFLYIDVIFNLLQMKDLIQFKHILRDTKTIIEGMYVCYQVYQTRLTKMNKCIWDTTTKTCISGRWRYEHSLFLLQLPVEIHCHQHVRILVHMWLEVNHRSCSFFSEMEQVAFAKVLMVELSKVTIVKFKNANPGAWLTSPLVLNLTPSVVLSQSTTLVLVTIMCLLYKSCTSST